jgi:phosphinothricin acetyltransferase
VTVAEVEAEILGWASLSEFRERAAYRHTVENSVYVRHDSHGRGIGSALLKDSIDRARQIGHHTIIGVLDAEQTASVALHKKFGFTICGEMKEVGFKFDRWLNVIIMQLML